MTKIAYILGAGASAKAMPTVNQISRDSRITKIVGKLMSPTVKLNDNEFFMRNHEPLLETKWHYQKKLIDDLNWLQEVSKAHASVDTYAKKLTIRNKNEELNRLKIVLSVYLALEQIENGLDDRYDTFFASLIDADGTMPENVSLITWNYDNQIELGYSGFTELSKLSEITARLGIRSKNTVRVKPSTFPIYRLNGVSGYKERGSSIIQPFARNADANLNKETVDFIVGKYVSVTERDDIVPTIYFAWEDVYSSKNSIFEEIQDTLKGTTVVIIIGYSFPFFNRKIDKKIFGYMSDIRKIYYQDIIADKLKVRLEAVGQFEEHVDIVPYPDADQFLVPYEL